jgi:hypothetical protein
MQNDFKNTLCEMRVDFGVATPPRPRILEAGLPWDPKAATGVPCSFKIAPSS